MARYLTEKDFRLSPPIIFEDGITAAIPVVGPDSDMDGHDLSDLTRREMSHRDAFISTFNEYCADNADEIIYMGARLIRVKMRYRDVPWEDDDGLESSDLPRKQMIAIYDEECYKPVAYTSPPLNREEHPADDSGLDW